MTKVVLFCPEPAGLTLGPGSGEESIKFRDGFASFDSDEYPDWESWVRHPGTPHIEVLPDGSSQVPPAGAAFICAIDGRGFTAKIGYLSHMRTHAGD